MKAKILFPYISFKRLLDKIRGIEDKVNEQNEKSINTPVTGIVIEEKNGMVFVHCSAAVTVESFKSVQFPKPNCVLKISIVNYVHTDNSRNHGYATLNTDGKISNVYYIPSGHSGVNNCSDTQTMQFASFSYLEA